VSADDTDTVITSPTTAVDNACTSTPRRNRPAVTFDGVAEQSTVSP
jgi:hypothetical protein